MKKSQIPNLKKFKSLKEAFKDVIKNLEEQHYRIHAKVLKGRADVRSSRR